jgi:hypothetical protein
VNWLRQLVLAAVALLLVSPLAAPQLLAFPHSKQIGSHRVYSELPITPQLHAIVAKADALASRSPIAQPNPNQRIFLTEGGWRWTWLTLTSRGAFAISRRGTENIVMNRSDAALDQVTNGRTIGGKRSLSGTIAHEMTHGAIRERFGLFADTLYPAWLREGYCDYVAGGGSLTDAEAATLIASGKDHPALKYWIGRRRVAAELQRNGGSVEALFATSKE